MRSRFLAILTLCTAMLWAFGEGHRAMASRQRARDADQEWQSQAMRLSAVREAWISRQAKSRAPTTAAAPVVSPSPPASVVATPAPPAHDTRGENRQLASNLRTSLGRFKVQVEECRVGSVSDPNGSIARSVRLKLLGSRDSLRRAVAAIRSDPRFGRLSGATYEPLKHGELRAIVVGVIRPQTARS